MFSEPKPVKCHVCDRGFKNIAALNGHMRLHGGYVRKVCHCHTVFCLVNVLSLAVVAYLFACS